MRLKMELSTKAIGIKWMTKKMNKSPSKMDIILGFFYGWSFHITRSCNIFDISTIKNFRLSQLAKKVKIRQKGAMAALSLSGTMPEFFPIRVLPSKSAIASVNPTFLPKTKEKCVQELSIAPTLIRRLHKLMSNSF